MSRKPIPIVVVAALAAAAAGAQAPVPVAPGGQRGDAVVAGACPTFHWGAVAGADAYELAVYRVTTSERAAEHLEPSLHIVVPAGARGWTPDLARCLEPGERYGWSVRALRPGSEGPWSEARLFRISEVPSTEEVRQALEVLRRHREESAPQTEGIADAAGSRQPVGQAEPRLAAGEAAPPVVVVRAAAPTLGPASLTLDGQVHLGSASHLFKGGSLFSWSDGTTGNLSLGHLALASNTTGWDNTALGRQALQSNAVGARSTAIGALALVDLDTGGNTAVGFETLRRNVNGSANTALGGLALSQNVGSDNTALGYDAMGASVSASQSTAVGSHALRANSNVRNTAVGYEALGVSNLGKDNTAVGHQALRELTGNGRDRNVALGSEALANLASGSDNVAIGYRAGINLTGGSNNIFIGSPGWAGEYSDTIQIGSAVDPIPAEVEIRGIFGSTVSLASGVVVNAEGRLGTTTSTARVKQDIQPLEGLADRLRALRPVAFRYKEWVARDPEAPLTFGLIVEEVAEVLPELVVPDRDGRPATVQYQVLSALLLALLDEDLQELALLEARLATLEARRGGSRRDATAGEASAEAPTRRGRR